MDSTERLKARLMRFFVTNAPEDVHKVDRLMRLPDLQENDVMQQLYTKYGRNEYGEPVNIGAEAAALEDRIAAFYEQYVPEKEVASLVESSLLLRLPEDKLFALLKERYADFTPKPFALRVKLRRILLRAAPEDVIQLAALLSLKRAEGDALDGDDLLLSVCEKYGVNEDGWPSEAAMRLQRRLVRFFENNDPGRLAEVPSLVASGGGTATEKGIGEEATMRPLLEQYGKDEIGDPWPDSSTGKAGAEGTRDESAGGGAAAGVEGHGEGDDAGESSSDGGSSDDAETSAMSGDDAADGTSLEEGAVGDHERELSMSAEDEAILEAKEDTPTRELRAWASTYEPYEYDENGYAYFYDAEGTAHYYYSDDDCLVVSDAADPAWPPPMPYEELCAKWDALRSADEARQIAFVALRRERRRAERKAATRQQRREARRIRRLGSPPPDDLRVHPPGDWRSIPSDAAARPFAAGVTQIWPPPISNNVEVLYRTALFDGLLKRYGAYEGLSACDWKSTAVHPHHDAFGRLARAFDRDATDLESRENGVSGGRARERATESTSLTAAASVTPVDRGWAASPAAVIFASGGAASPRRRAYDGMGATPAVQDYLHWESVNLRRVLPPGALPGLPDGAADHGDGRLGVAASAPSLQELYDPSSRWRLRETGSFAGSVPSWKGHTPVRQAMAATDATLRAAMEREREKHEAERHRTRFYATAAQADRVFFPEEPPSSPMAHGAAVGGRTAAAHRQLAKRSGAAHTTDRHHPGSRQLLPVSRSAPLDAIRGVDGPPHAAYRVLIPESRVVDEYARERAAAMVSREHHGDHHRHADDAATLPVRQTDRGAARVTPAAARKAHSSPGRRRPAASAVVGGFIEEEQRFDDRYPLARAVAALESAVAAAIATDDAPFNSSSLVAETPTLAAVVRGRYAAVPLGVRPKTSAA